MFIILFQPKVPDILNNSFILFDDKLLQNELEITRGEKRRAQEKIKILEEEHKIQTELLKREVEKKAKSDLE
jgi:hypothetical protein